MRSLKEEWDKVEAQNSRLLAELKAYAHTETLMQHQINGLESEVERLKDDLSDALEEGYKLRAEVERLTTTLKAERQLFDARYSRIETLTAEVERLLEKR